MEPRTWRVRVLNYSVSKISVQGLVRVDIPVLRAVLERTITFGITFYVVSRASSCLEDACYEREHW